MWVVRQNKSLVNLDHVIQVYTDGNSVRAETRHGTVLIAENPNKGTNGVNYVLDVIRYALENGKPVLNLDKLLEE